MLGGPALAVPIAVRPEVDVTRVFTNAGEVTQLAFGPDGRLYASRGSGGAVSFAYNAATGVLSNMKVVAAGVSGLGIASASGRATKTASRSCSTTRMA